MASKFGGAAKCTVCAKSVYPQEKVAVEKVTVHKACFKCSSCNTTLTVGNYHVVEDKLLCKNHYQQAFAHKAPTVDGKSATPRGTTPAETKKEEPKPVAPAPTPAKTPVSAPVKTPVTATPAKTPVSAPVKTPATTTPVTTTPAKTPVTTTPVTATPVKTPAADDSKALESLKQFSAALDKLEHTLASIERRL